MFARALRPFGTIMASRVLSRDRLHCPYHQIMSSFSGFWSYVRNDDQAEGGRIADLAHDIVAQYEMAADDQIDLFLDRESIAWGAAWQEVIDDSLTSVAFFIPVLTPRYFTSPACRHELNTFARRAIDLGVSDLILPILYVDIPGLSDDEPADELMALVKRFNWVDWRGLRFADRSERDYRKEVSALASRLVAANRSSETGTDAEQPLVPTEVAESGEAGVIFVPTDDVEAEDENGGTLDLLARYEMAMTELTATTQSLSPLIVELGEAAEDIGAQAGRPENSSFARRLQLLRSLAARMATPVAEILRLGDDYTAQLHDVDVGMRLIVARAPEEPQGREEFRTLFGTVRELAETADESFAQLEGMVESVVPLEKLSRELRPVTRDLRRGIATFVDGNEVIQDWVLLIDEAGF